MHHLIYLYKDGHPQDTSFWKYYRISSEGKMGDHIEVCLVEWPTFKDIDKPGEIDKAPVINPADTGFTSAYPNFLTLLKNKWGIEYRDEDLIGVIGNPTVSRL